MAHAAAQGHQTACVRTVDGDVVVLAIHFFSTVGLAELWVYFDSGKNGSLRAWTKAINK